MIKPTNEPIQRAALLFSPHAANLSDIEGRALFNQHARAYLPTSHTTSLCCIQTQVDTGAIVIALKTTPWHPNRGSVIVEQIGNRATDGDYRSWVTFSVDNNNETLYSELWEDMRWDEIGVIPWRTFTRFVESFAEDFLHQVLRYEQQKKKDFFHQVLMPKWEKHDHFTIFGDFAWLPTEFLLVDNDTPPTFLTRAEEQIQHFDTPYHPDGTVIDWKDARFPHPLFTNRFFYYYSENPGADLVKFREISAFARNGTPMDIALFLKESSDVMSIALWVLSSFIDIRTASVSLWAVRDAEHAEACAKCIQTRNPRNQYPIRARRLMLSTPR